MRHYTIINQFINYAVNRNGLIVGNSTFYLLLKNIYYSIAVYHEEKN